MKTSELKLHKRNPRQISRPAMDKLKDSIERDPEFMKLRPIVVDENNTVLGGNQRLRAIRELGYKDIPDEWVKPATGMDAEKLRRFMLIDNLPLGEWDIDILSADFELPELEELGFNLGDLGLDLGDGDIKGEPGDEHQKLSDRFGVPPFSVLNAREGWWQDRKRAWIDLGIKSELGRGGIVNDSGTSDNGKSELLQKYKTLGAIAPNENDILKRRGNYK